MDDQNFSKIEQLLLQLTEWKAKFFHEREWRASVEKERSELQEKYSQIVYELGTQKKAIEQLEERVKMLSSGTSQVIEDVRKPSREKPAGHEEGRGGEGVSHHVYTNPRVHHSTAHVLFSDLVQRKWRENGVPAHEETTPYILHRYDPEFRIKEPPIDFRQPSEKLDEILDRELK